MKKFKINLFFILLFILFFISCKTEKINGTYYIDESDTKITFEGNSLNIDEDSIPIYTATLYENSELYSIYYISQIHTNGIINDYKKVGMEIGNKIYIELPEKILNFDSYDDTKEQIQFKGKFFNEYYTYLLNEKRETPSYFNNMFLKEVELKSFYDLNYPTLNSFYDFIVLNNFDESIISEINKILDGDKNTFCIIPVEIFEKIGFEFSINKKVDDIENKITDSNLVISAIKITLLDDDYFMYNRPSEMEIYYTSISKDNPGYKSKIYENKTTILIDDIPGEQVFYFLEPIMNLKSMYLNITGFYNGLTDNVSIVDIEFYIE